jgi:C1A family cysteine protease
MIKSSLNKNYGWIPERPGKRFEALKLDLLPESELPKSVDLRDTFPPCYDQGQLGSCTANGIAGLIHHRMIVSNYKWQFTPSRLFIYYGEREIEGTIMSDSGANISDGIIFINKYGVCPEIEADKTNPNWLWTYDDNPNDSIIPPRLAKFKQRPPSQCYTDAILHKSVISQTVNLDRLTVLNTLAQKRPITFGFNVYQSFEDQSTIDSGVMPIPGSNEQELGGHCVDAAGYLLNTPMGNQGVIDWALVRNSWGTDIYGSLQGHFWMPLDQILCSDVYSSDAHTVDLVLGENQHN